MTDTSTPSSDTVESAENRSTENPTLGEHNGYELNMAIRRVPDGAEYPDEFAVNLYIAQEDRDNIDIARVDTAHGETHVDRCYLPEGHERRKHDPIDIEKPEQAVAYFTTDSKWRGWVERYDENHGLP